MIHHASTNILVIIPITILIEIYIFIIYNLYKAKREPTSISREAYWNLVLGAMIIPFFIVCLALYLFKKTWHVSRETRHVFLWKPVIIFILMA